MRFHRLFRARAFRCGCVSAACCAALVAPQRAAAQQPVPRDTTIRRDTAGAPLTVTGITVIGTAEDRADARAQLRQVPGSVALIEAPQLRVTRQANLNDVLRMTPGVFVQSRFGAADESQLSVRGSGLRNNFHLRGINVLVNGMPYRNADGFTDFESLELLTTENIQVWKGGNALRYGGSTLGGGINLETRTGYTAERVQAYADGGSFGFLKAQASTGGTHRGLDWYASYARTTLDGYRDWADQGRDRVNLHAGWALSPKLDLRTFALYARVREHLPGSLTAAEAAADPTQAVPGNVTGRWGRDYDLYHVGAQLRAEVAGGRLEVAPYFQYRDIDHPIFQVIRQFSRDGGVEARYENSHAVGSHANRFTLGAQYARGNTDNRRYVNNAGQHGALTKAQMETAGNTAFYAENALGLTARLTAVLGVRYDHSMRRVADNFLSDGDQSEERSYNEFMPKVGLLYELGGRAQLYANASRSFEPPLLLELNSLTVPGFVNVLGQSAWQYEVGTRGRRGVFNWDVALYDAELTNELTNLNVPPFPGAPFTVPTYTNIPKSRHYGLEAALGARIARGLFSHARADELTMQLAYTFARYRFVTDTAWAGNEIPGAPRHMVSGELTWRHPSGLSIAPRVDWMPQSYAVNNDNSAFNRSWTTVGLRADWLLSRTGLTAFGEVRNLMDETYSGSVQVNDANGRFYEPADGRAFYLGLRYQY